MTTVRWFPGKAKEVTREGGIIGLHRGAEFLLAKANETVPIEEGTLKASGDTDINGDRLISTVYYNTPYAARQHEEVRFSHKAGRRAKWLQLTFQEQQRSVIGILADAMKKEWPG